MTELSKDELKRVLNVNIKDLNLYKHAMIHKSACRDMNSASNERLEFIGDSVLNMVIAHYLFNKYPDENEGFLTRIRTKMVGGKNLSYLGKCLNFQDYVIMNEKAMKQEWNHNPRILEDVFEAIIGAIYLDLGLSEARNFIINTMEKYIDFNDLVIDTNYKDILMRFVQSTFNDLPEYKTSYSKGPDHSKLFTLQVYIKGKLVAEGISGTKKQAEQNAAYRVLKSLLIV